MPLARRGARGGHRPRTAACRPFDPVALGTHMLRSLTPFLFATALVRAQFFPLEITEVLVKPAPGGHPIIELSTSNVPIDLTGHQLVIDATPVALPSVWLPPFTLCQLHLGVSGTTTSSHISLPTAPALPAVGSVALFRSSSFTAAELVAYVDWSGGFGPYLAVAVQAGQWTSVGESAVLPSQAGATLANRRWGRTASTLVGPLAWYADTTPTLGSENDPGYSQVFGVGCTDPQAPTWGLPVETALDPGPWLGETTTYVVRDVPAIALVVAGSTLPTPVPLDAIGMPGCTAYVSIENTLLLPALGGNATMQLAVPLAPQFLGFALNLQAFVPSGTAGNPLQAYVSDALRGIVGSR
ncbi:MAG: hypothetical protein JNL08_19030 [Planctomycetes bacterium]|nr:hypothetical protein [Planctomycetota bacterium]